MPLPESLTATRWRMLILAAAAGLAIGILAVPKIVDSYGPVGAVTAYFDAIAAGDNAEALSYTAEHSRSAFTSDYLLADDITPLEPLGYSDILLLDSTGLDTVPVAGSAGVSGLTEQVAGVKVIFEESPTISYWLQQTETGEWLIGNPFIVLSVPAPDVSVSIDGTAVGSTPAVGWNAAWEPPVEDSTQAAPAAAGFALLPGRYSVELDRSDAFDPKRFDFAPDSKEDVAGTELTIRPTVSHAMSNWLDEYLAGCADAGAQWSDFPCPYRAEDAEATVDPADYQWEPPETPPVTFSWDSPGNTATATTEHFGSWRDNVNGELTVDGKTEDVEGSLRNVEIRFTAEESGDIEVTHLEFAQ